MTDRTGTVVWAADYKPFGEATVTVSTITNNLRFPGQYYDAETGLNYNYFRDYNPVIGRYVEGDPIGLWAGISLYSYVDNNPVNLVDPFGLIRKCIKKLMLVTAYNDNGPGSDSPYQVGIGTVAVANYDPATKKPRHDPKKGAYPIYPYGADVKVLGPKGEIDYQGSVHDTGRGWDPQHHNVSPDEWIDIWIKGKGAKKWGKQWREVEICYDEKCK